MNSISTTSSVLVGRQPIFDGKLDVVGYELLHRTSGENVASFDDGNQATSQLLVNALVEIGLDRLTGDRLAFVNFTRDFLVGEFEIPFEKDRLVVEVLEDVPADREVLEGLKELRDKGFRIALDDIAAGDSRYELLENADILKIDLRGYDHDSIERDLQRFRRYPCQLLAEKVETAEEFEYCRDLGFDLFQGYFLAQPRIVKGKGLASNQLAIIQLLARLQDTDVTFEEIIALIKKDVSTGLKLLRYANSSAFGLRGQIDSISQVSTLLGLRKIRQMVSLIMVAGIGDKPSSLLADTLIRARMCELLANRVSCGDPEACFTAGMFSNLAALLDCPLPEILDQLPLATELRQALLNREGDIGRLLNSVIAFERGDAVDFQWLKPDTGAIQESHLQAIAWVHGENGVMNQIC